MARRFSNWKERVENRIAKKKDALPIFSETGIAKLHKLFLIGYSEDAAIFWIFENLTDGDISRWAKQEGKTWAK